MLPPHVVAPEDRPIWHTQDEPCLGARPCEAVYVGFARHPWGNVASEIHAVVIYPEGVQPTFNDVWIAAARRYGPPSSVSFRGGRVAISQAPLEAVLHGSPRVALPLYFRPPDQRSYIKVEASVAWHDIPWDWRPWRWFASDIDPPGRASVSALRIEVGQIEPLEPPLPPEPRLRF